MNLLLTNHVTNRKERGKTRKGENNTSNIVDTHTLHTHQTSEKKAREKGHADEMTEEHRSYRTNHTPPLHIKKGKKKFRASKRSSHASTDNKARQHPHEHTHTHTWTTIHSDMYDMSQETKKWMIHNT